MKKLVINTLWTSLMAVLGLVIIGLYLVKWVPFSAPILVGLWAYLGWAVGFAVLAVGLSNNLFVIAAINAFIKR